MEGEFLHFRAGFAEVPEQVRELLLNEIAAWESKAQSSDRDSQLVGFWERSEQDEIAKSAEASERLSAEDFAFRINAVRS